MSISENIVSLAFDTAGLEIFQVFRSAPLTLGKCRATPIPLRLFSSAELKKVKFLSKVTIFRMFQHEPSHKFKKSCNIFIYRWFPTKTLCINPLDPGSPYYFMSFFLSLGMLCVIFLQMRLFLFSSCTVEPWNRHSPNSHTYENSHTLFVLTKMRLFGYVKDIRRKLSLNFLSLWANRFV